MAPERQGGHRTAVGRQPPVAAQLCQNLASYKAVSGFGDPLFRSSGGDKRGVARLQPYQDYYKGTLVDLDALRKGLPALPETGEELRAVARELGAPESEVRLGREVTVTSVRAASLEQYRVVGFATHGLVAGEVNGLSEPALVLSLPDNPSADDDGLLTASRVAKLTLDADWAVLSACNTAAGDKPGAEGLSGLARAFFYAGARSLLVSHWPVEFGRCGETYHRCVFRACETSIDRARRGAAPLDQSADRGPLADPQR